MNDSSSSLDFSRNIDLKKHVIILKNKSSGGHFKIIPIILTTKDSPRTEICLKECSRVGINPYIFYGLKTDDPKNLASTITENHYQILSFFNELWKRQSLEEDYVREHDSKKNRSEEYHLMVLEDDCEFTTQNIIQLLEEYLNHISSCEQRWTTIHLGHCPLGPLIPFHKNLFYSTFPWTAHCYLINGASLNKLLNENHKREWKRPYALEGWLCVSSMEKFAFSPPLATQTILPKEIRQIPILNDISLMCFCELLDFVMMVIPILLVILVIFGLYYFVFMVAV